ncbi:MAG: hypothetical protein ACP5RP_01350 [Candidatus Micrarchaeia archaeon]
MRSACSFGNRFPTTIYSTKINGKESIFYNLYTLYKDDGKVKKIMLYYDDFKKGSDIIKYTIDPLSKYSTESYSFVNTLSSSTDTDYFIKIVELPSNIFSSATISSKEITSVRLSLKDFIHSQIIKSLHKGSVYKSYVFNYNGKQIISAFDLFPDISSENSNVLYYSVIGAENTHKSKFVKYNTLSDKYDFVDTISSSETYTLYLKVINLYEPFKFFNINNI